MKLNFLRTIIVQTFWLLKPLFITGVVIFIENLYTDGAKSYYLYSHYSMDLKSKFSHGMILIKAQIKVSKGTSILLKGGGGGYGFFRVVATLFFFYKNIIF